LSKELDRPIVCLSQINRVSDNRTPVTVGGFDFKVPAMIDLADSSSLEKDADCILMLSVAEEMDTGRRPLLTNGQNPAVIRIEKNRKGEKGHIIKLSFNGGTTTFTESGW
jgi:replicative DNA helicase